MRALKVGDPIDQTTEIGPFATEQILQGVHEQVQKSIAAGAKLLTGGNRIHGPGFFYEPTVLVDVPKDSPAYREEVFGPVASIFRVRDADEAIEMANDTLVRARRERVDERSGGTGTFRVGAGNRNGFHQRHGRLRSASAVRRSETFRLRSRTRRRRDPRVHQYEDDLDFLRNRDSDDSPTPGNSTVKGATVARMKNLRILVRSRIGDHIDRGSVCLIQSGFLHPEKTENARCRSGIRSESKQRVAIRERAYWPDQPDSA